MSILDTIDRAIDGLCPCGDQPRPGSAYCGPDCEPTHLAPDSDTRTAGRLATPARWRPDLTITDEHEFGHEPVDAPTHYDGPYFARLLRPTDNPDALSLRLDDGHRWVGHTIHDWDGTFPPALVDRMKRTWRRLERQLTDPDRADHEPPPPDLRPALLRDVPAETQQQWQWWCPTCRQPLPTARWHGDIPYHLLDDYSTFHRITLHREQPPPPPGDLLHLLRRAFGLPTERIEAAQAALGIPGWQRRCHDCGAYGEPTLRAQPAGGPRLLDTAGSALVALELRQACPHCNAAHPGPPLAMATEYRPDRREWHYRLRARADAYTCDEHTVIREERLEDAPDPVAYLRREWDRMEAAVLRAVTEHEQAQG